MKHIVIFLLFFIPFFCLGQEGDPGTKTVHDSLSRRQDTLRRKDTAVHARDSTHYTDSIHYHFSYAGTGNVNNTNTLSAYIFSNTIGFSAVKKSAAFNLNNSWVYGSSSGTLTNNDFTSTADLNLYKTLKHFYYWGLVNYNTSLSLQINHLVQGGLGAGYNLIDQKKAVLILSDGLLYEQGDLYDVHYGGPGSGLTQRDVYQELRNSLRIKYHWVIRDKVILDGMEFIQNALTHDRDYILKLSGSASVKLNKWLNLTAACQYNRFTRTNSENTLVTFGVTIVR